MKSAQYSITNDGNFEDLYKQIDNIIKEILEKNEK
jgi:dephospho-CoA kinase